MQQLDYLKETPSQTAGPYVHIGLVPNKLGIGGIYPHDLGESPISEGAKGERIKITGTVQDGAGMVMRDALIESWQADAEGIYSANDPRGAGDPNVSGWARIIADFDSGEWTLDTIKPGRVPTPTGQLMAPHISLWVVARGINLGLNTRIYFEDEENDSCPILAKIEHRPRMNTLIAKKTGAGEYRFDIILQGENETVFFDV